MDKRTEALVILGATLIIGAIASAIAKHEAALLGFSALEVALLGLAVGGAVSRSVKQA